MDPLLDDPASLTPQQRFQAVAAILARGVLRLKKCPAQSSQLAPTLAPLREERAPGVASISLPHPQVLVYAVPEAFFAPQ